MSESKMFTVEFIEGEPPNSEPPTGHPESHLSVALRLGPELEKAQARIETLESQLLEASELLQEPIGYGVGILCVAEAVRVVLAQRAKLRDALKFYGNPQNWRFTHDKDDNLLWVSSLGPDYALEILDDDELNTLKPHCGTRGVGAYRGERPAPVHAETEKEPTK
jgi:hypothetical protein